MSDWQYHHCSNNPKYPQVYWDEDGQSWVLIDAFDAHEHTNSGIVRSHVTIQIPITCCPWCGISLEEPEDE